MSLLFAFDLDGTLVDSRLDLAQSANELLASYGRTPLAPDQVASMVGEGARVLIERVLAAGGVHEPIDQALESFLAIYERRLTNHTVLYPGALEALDLLRARAALAVVTNKPTRHTRLLLEALGVTRYFVCAIGVDDAFARKPDPAGLRHVIEVAGATEETTVMVGDSMIDVETAQRAGTRLAVALYGLGRFPDPSQIPADATLIHRSEDLPAVCAGLAARLGRTGGAGRNPT